MSNQFIIKTINQNGDLLEDKSGELLEKNVSQHCILFITNKHMLKGRCVKRSEEMRTTHLEIETTEFEEATRLKRLFLKDNEIEDIEVYLVHFVT
jgi:hypothetical protein